MKKIAVLNDLSGMGKCSLTAAIPVISVMGIQACPLPTAVLSAQTGFPSFYCVFYYSRYYRLYVLFSSVSTTGLLFLLPFTRQSPQADKILCPSVQSS